MSAFLVSLWALAIALLCQALVAGWAIEVAFRQQLASGLRRAWLAMAIAALLSSLFHGYTLELALRTGLYDVRQAVLGALVSAIFALAIFGFRRPLG